MTDLILACDDIVTLDPRHPAASAVAITGGRITAVGDRADVPAWRGPRTEVIDLGGASLTPGLTDSHMHPVLGLNMTAGLDLSGCTELSAVRAALHAAAAAAVRLRGPAIARLGHVYSDDEQQPAPVPAGAES